MGPRFRFTVEALKAAVLRSRAKQMPRQENAPIPLFRAGRPTESVDYKLWRIEGRGGDIMGQYLRVAAVRQNALRPTNLGRGGFAFDYKNADGMPVSVPSTHYLHILYFFFYIFPVSVPLRPSELTRFRDIFDAQNVK